MVDGPGTVGWESSRANRAERALDKATARIAELEDELRGVIHEMKHISDEARKGRSWLRVELLADNVHTVLRNKLKT